MAVTAGQRAVRSGYKQTSAGVIPEDWGVSTVGREFEIQLGKMLDAERNTGVLKPYLGNRAVQWDRVIIDELPTVAMSRSDLERFLLRRDDLLVCEGGEVGRAAIWEAPIEECYYQKALHRLRPLRGFNSRLMVALLRYWVDRGLLANYVTQTSIAHLTREKLAGVPMPLPSPPEQTAIATALRNVDLLAASLEELITKKRDIKTAAMQQLLTGKCRLPGFSGEWKEKKLRELLMYEQPIRYLVKNTDYSDSYGTPVLTAGKTFILGYTAEETGIFHDVPVIIFDDFTTASKYVEFPFKAKSSAMKLLKRRGDRVNLRFVFERMQLIDFALADHKRYWISEYQNIEIEVPEPDEQTAIASFLSDIDADITALESRRDKARALKQGMMQQLLTGRVRLV